jgi:TP901 family phage tail tape measure protein
MVDQVRLTGDANPLVNALNRGTEAWNRFQGAQARVVNESARVGRNGPIITRTLQSIDQQGRRVTATFRGVAGAMQLVSTSVQKTSSTISASQRATDELNRSLRQIKQAVGFSLLFRSVTALQSALTQGTEDAIEFSRRIAEIRTIQGRASLSSAQWTSNLRELSDSFGIDILNQAEAAYQTLSNQVAQGRDAFLFLETANKLALTAVTDTASSVDLLTSAVNAFQLDASQADKVAAQFFKTVELGRVRIEELSDIFGRIGVPANQLGISLQEVNAAIAAVTIQGVKSEEAITLVRNVILKLIRPTDDMKRIFQELGVASAEAGVAAFGFGGFLARIEKAAGGTTTGLGKAFGRVRALTGALVLGRQGLDAYQKALDAQNDPNLLKDFEKNFQEVFNSNGEVIKRETNRLRNFFQVELGQEVLKSAADFSRNFGGVTPVIEQLATTIRILAVPALVLLSSRLLTVGTSAITAAGGLKAFALSNPFTAILVGGAAVISIIDEVTESSEEAAVRIEKANEKVLKGLAETSGQQQKLIVTEIDNAFRALQQSSRQNLQPIISGVIAPLNAEFARLNKDAKDFNKEVTRAASATLKSANNIVKQTDRQIRNLSKAAVTARGEIEKSTRSTEQEVFQIRLDSAGFDRKLSLLRRRIESLREARDQAVRTGDASGFNRAQKELTKLVIQREALRLAAQSQLTPEERINNSIRTREKLLEDENKLRIRLIRQIEAQRSAAERVRAEQQLLQKDLQAALKVFRGESLTEALGGDDEGQIRRALAERQNAARRLAALQDRLGITSVGGDELQQSQTRDELNAVNRINKIRADAAVKARQELNKQIQTRLEAQKALTVEQDKAFQGQVETLTRLRGLFASNQTSRVRPDAALRGEATAVLAEITRPPREANLRRGIGAPGSQGADAVRLQFEEPIRQLQKLIDLTSRDPSTLTGFEASEAEQLQSELAKTLREVVDNFNPDTFARSLQGELGKVRVGRGEFTRSAVTQEDIDEDIRNVRVAFKTLQDGLRTIESSEGDLLTQRQALIEGQKSLAESAKRVAKEFDTVAPQIAAVAGPEAATLDQLLERRRALANPNQVSEVTVDVASATKAATPQLTQSYRAAVIATAPDVAKVQVEAVKAAEAAKAKESSTPEGRALSALGISPKTNIVGPEKPLDLSTPEGQAARAKALGGGTAADQRAVLADKRAKELQDKLAAEAKQREVDAAKAKEFRRKEEENARRPETGLQPGEASARRQLAIARGDTDILGNSLLEPTGLDISGLETSLPEAATQLDVFNLALEEVSEKFLRLGFGPGTRTGAPGADAINQPPNLFGGTATVAGQQSDNLGVTFDDAGKITSVAFEETANAARTFEIDLDAAGNAVRELALETVKARQDLAALRLERRNTPQQAPGGPPGSTAIRGFANGGVVPGVGTKDSVPAMLTPGERVLTRAQNRAFTPDLIRSGTPRARQPQSNSNSIDFGGFTVNESSSGQQTAREIQRIINRGLRQGSIKTR